ncbi:hypothetical protein ACHAWF_012207, partial [Thalassiosira exigua]
HFRRKSTKQRRQRPWPSRTTPPAPPAATPRGTSPAPSRRFPRRRRACESFPTPRLRRNPSGRGRGCGAGGAARPDPRRRRPPPPPFALPAVSFAFLDSLSRAPRVESSTLSFAFSSSPRPRKNAWESSGAKDVLANAQSNLPQGTQDALGKARQRIFNRQNLRSPAIFFGFGEEQPFYVEKVPSLLTERLRHNASFFYLNYALVTTVLFCLTLLISPSAIIGIGLLGFAWAAVIRATSEGSMQVKGITVTQKQASIGMGGVSVIVLIWLLSHMFWMSLLTSGFLCGVHGLLRDASMHKDEEDKVVMQGDLNLDEEEAGFLSTPAEGGVSGGLA